MKRDEFHSDVRARPGILRQLEKDADKMAAAGDTRRVLFCFTSDPFQNFPEGEDVTRQALQIMVDRGLPFEVCTKGGLRVERDFDLLKQGGRLGVSLVWGEDDTWTAQEMEPSAAIVEDRTFAVYNASQGGIYCWASIEPVIDAGAALRAIDVLDASGCNEFRVGKINHNRELEAAVDWQAFVDEAYALLVATGKKFMFKHSLGPWLHDRPATGPEGSAT